MNLPTTPALTIGRLARTAGVGIETGRYSQQRALLPVPPPSGAQRHYPAQAVQRIRFIKRAQELGFSLDEIAELLRLQDGSDHEPIRQVASQRLAQIEHKLADLRRMQKVLRHLVEACEHTGADAPCPIIESLAHPQRARLEAGVAPASSRRPDLSRRP
jgi:MerR family mercuric resistance operon transcriptional regulator